MSKERIMDSASPVEGVPVEDEKAGARVAVRKLVKLADALWACADEQSAYRVYNELRNGILALEKTGQPPFQVGDWVPVVLDEWNGDGKIATTHILRDAVEVRIANGARALTLIATRDEASKDSTHDASGEANAKPLNQNLPPESEANNGTD